MNTRMLMLLVALLLAALLFAWWRSTRVVPAASSASAFDTAVFQGEWYSAAYRYAFRIEGEGAVATLSNSPRYHVGQVMLRFRAVSRQGFQGEQLFTDGRWYPVAGRLLDARTLHMEGGGFVWTMTRQPPPGH